jgi:hypothetical protein
MQRWRTAFRRSGQCAWAALGARTLAHLSVRTQARLRAVGLSGDGGFALPLTQEEIADVLGLTSVHVNRTLQTLRSTGMIRLKDQRLQVPDLQALQRLAGFDARYLHLPSEDGTSRSRVAEPVRTYQIA